MQYNTNITWYLAFFMFDLISVKNMKTFEWMRHWKRINLKFLICIHKLIDLYPVGCYIIFMSELLCTIYEISISWSLFEKIWFPVFTSLQDYCWLQCLLPFLTDCFKYCNSITEYMISKNLLFYRFFLGLIKFNFSNWFLFFLILLLLPKININL